MEPVHSALFFLQGGATRQEILTLLESGRRKIGQDILPFLILV